MYAAHKIATRGYASVAAPSVTSTANGIRVAASGADTGLATVSLVINAGSRHESIETAGAAHFLKAFGFRNTRTRTSFRTIREAELNGAQLAAEATRENVVYRVQCFRDAVPYFVDVLGDVAAATRFAEHEFRDVARVVEFEALSARADPVTRALDGVHQAAFRGGLGNSLYAPLGSPVGTGNAVAQYAQAALAGGRVAVVGTGVDAAELTRLVGESQLGQLPSQGAAAPVAAAQFAGGVQQVYESAAPVAHYALAFSCAPEAAPVLAALLGTQRRAKWGVGTSPLAQTAARMGFSAEAFSFGYSDAGLVGVLVSAPAAQLRAAVQAVAASVQKDVARPAADCVQRAVAAARVDVADQLASHDGAARVLGQIALGQSAATLESVEKAGAALAATAEAVFASKPVAVSIGLPQATPYVDTLGF
ncbi:ubiquinol-cytochrome c reductase core subunit 1 [Coemansia erecta]|nr:ubiquinol-cytochrome c reductase core subunit 1 [Coemansia sp. RSA 2618]KAJ2830453.1 ubiquinol-cytochrome c reductase core subunit 1 [Coemansia erecta]